MDFVKTRLARPAMIALALVSVFSSRESLARPVATRLERRVVHLGEDLSIARHQALAETGVELLRYKGNGFYLVAIEPGLFVSPPDPDVDSLAGDKLSHSLQREELPEWVERDAEGRFEVVVTFVSGTPGRLRQRILGRAGTAYGTNSTLVRMGRAEIVEIASSASVDFVELGPGPFVPLSDDYGRTATRTDIACAIDMSNSRPSYRVSGNGVAIGVFEESGVDSAHHDLFALSADGSVATSRVQPTRPGRCHATWVAGVAAGNGFNSTASGLDPFAARGHAPEATVGDYEQFHASPQNYAAAVEAAGLNVTNHSYTQQIQLFYDQRVQQIDCLIRGRELCDVSGFAAVPQVWAAGNFGKHAGGEVIQEGYYSVTAPAKNPIVVGAIDSTPLGLDGWRLSSFSSIGPTFDGRIKPDVVAVGCRDSSGLVNFGLEAVSAGTQSYSTKCDARLNYRKSCGTSIAAPAVSGIIALLMEQYRVSYGIAPSLRASTYKAWLIHTAIDLVKLQPYAPGDYDNADTDEPIVFHAGPDFATGYGLVDAEGARNIVTTSAHWAEGAIGSSDDEEIWCIAVPVGTTRVKATLVWDDEPGDPCPCAPGTDTDKCTSLCATPGAAETSAKLVNDLDIEVRSPSGTIHRPLVLPAIPSPLAPGDGSNDPVSASDVQPAGPGVDRTNNVEMVVAGPSGSSVPSGVWRIRIKGHHLPLPFPQPYSLVSSHPLLGICPAGVGSSCDPAAPDCVCASLPQVCGDGREPPVRDSSGGWNIDSTTVLPLGELCKTVDGCPSCELHPWEDCPGWSISMDEPTGLGRVWVFDEDGTVVGNQQSGSIDIPRHKPGSRFFVAFSQSDGTPLAAPLTLHFGGVVTMGAVASHQ